MTMGQGGIYGNPQQQVQFPLFAGKGFGMGPFANMYTKDPRQALAYNLMAQGTSTAPVQHWTQGLARMLNSGIGAWLDNRTREEYEGRNRRLGEDTKAIFAPVQMPANEMDNGGERPATLTEMLQRASQTNNPDLGSLAQQLAITHATQQAEDERYTRRQSMERQQNAVTQLSPQEVAALGLPAGTLVERNGMGQTRIVSKPETNKAQSTVGQIVADQKAGLITEDQARAAIAKVTGADKEQNSRPFAGTAMDAQYLNILLSGDPASPEYHAAYAAFGAPKTSFDMTTGSVVTIQPSMAAFRPPVGMSRQPGASSNGGAPVGTPALAPSVAAQSDPVGSQSSGPQPSQNGGPLTARLSDGTNISPVAAPQGPLSQQLSAPPRALPVVGSAPGTPTTQQIGGATITTQSGTPRKDQEQLRTALTEAATIVNSLGDLRDAYGKAGVIDRGKSMLGMTTPLNTAYNKSALMAKGEALFNLGVLNGPDLEVIRRVLPDPSTLKGSAADMKAVENAISQVETLIQDRVTARMSQLGMEPMDIRQYGRQIRAAGPGNSAPPSSGEPLRLSNDTEGKAAYDRLPPGAEYIAPDGSRRRKQ